MKRGCLPRMQADVKDLFAAFKDRLRHFYEFGFEVRQIVCVPEPGEFGDRISLRYLAHLFFHSLNLFFSRAVIGRAVTG